MIPYNVQNQLKELEGYLNKGVLVPAIKITDKSVVCLIQYGGGIPIAYHQSHMDRLPAPLMESLIGKRKGEMVGDIKIIAIYEHCDIGAPLGQFFN